MGNITIAAPDQRVNLGSRPDRDDGTIEVAVRVTLTAAEAQIIAGASDDIQEACNLFVRDWVSPSLSALGRWLGQQATRNSCRLCGGTLIGSERGYGTCGQCGGRAVAS